MTLSPSSLAPELHQALRTLATKTPLVIALDFDGTMAPLVDRPEDARPLPESAALTFELSRLPGVITALISGRDLASLVMVHPEPRPEVLIGSHGAERNVPPSLHTAAQSIELSTQQTELLNHTTQILAEVVAKFDGSSLEHKPASTVLHVRQAEDTVGRLALAEAQERLHRLAGLRLIAGKAVLEASVLDTTKGQALMWLREVSHAAAMLFVGDDVTDEDGFRVLGQTDLGIKVGSGSTLAHHRIPTPDDLPQLLRFLLQERLATTTQNGV